MKNMTEKSLSLALFAVVAMNLVALLARTGTAQTSPAEPSGTYQASCVALTGNPRDWTSCVLIDTRTGAVVKTFDPFN
jgi:hypothetical protein